MNYTKGNWKQDEFEVTNYSIPIKRIYISSESGEFAGRTLADIGFWRDFPKNMVRANANLIAAAPNMYEALKGII